MEYDKENPAAEIPKEFAKDNELLPDEVTQQTETAPDELTNPTATTPDNFTEQTATLTTIEQYISDATYTIDSIFAPPVPIIKIGESIAATLGNFSLLIGKAKGGKGFTYTLILGFILKAYNLQGLFKSEFPDGRDNVIIFDTEQAGFHAHKVLKRINKLGGDTSKIKGLKLRPYAPNIRLEIIEKVIETTHKTTSFYIIDGIRDVAQKGINDEETATVLSSKLLEWTDKYKIHITVILHQNKGNEHARGHLGTELVNKAETVIATTKAESDTDITTVTCEMARNKSFAPFAFKIIDGIPELTDVIIKTDSKDKIIPTGFDKRFHQEMITRIFKNKTEFSNPDLRSSITYEFEIIGHSVKDTKAKGFVKHWEANNYIQNTGKQGTTQPKVWVSQLGQMESDQALRQMVIDQAI